MGLVRNSFYLFASNIYFQMIGYVATFFMARNLGVSRAGLIVFGSYMALVLIINMITSLADFSMSTAFEKEIASGNRSKKVTGTYIVYRFLVMLAAAAIIFAIAPYLSKSFNIDSVFAIRVAAFVPVVWVPTRVFARMNIAKGLALYSQVPNILENTLRTLFVAYAAIFIRTTNSLIISFFFASVVSAIVSLFLLYRFIGLFDLKMLYNMFKFSYPLGIAVIIGYFSQNVDSYIVLAYGTSYLAGLYIVSKGFFSMIMMIPTVLVSLLFPDFVNFSKNRNLANLAERFMMIQKYLLMLITPMIVFVVIYRVNLLHILYSNAFMVVSPEVVILTVSVIPQSYTTIYGTLLTSINKQRYLLYFTVIEVVTLFSVAIILVPSIGLLGAALAFFFSSVITASFAIVAGYMHIHTYPDFKEIIKIIAAAIISFATMSFFNKIVSLNRWYAVLSVGVIAIVVYYLMLILLRVLRSDDIDMLFGQLGVPRFILRVLKKICLK